MTIDQSKVKKAEQLANQAEKEADTANALAGRIKLQIEACLHKIKFLIDTIKALSIKADAESDASARHKIAMALAANAKCKAIEALAEAKLFRMIAESQKAKAKAANSADEKKEFNIQAKEAETKASKKEAEAKEFESEARRALSVAKKSNLEIKEAQEAKTAIEKHTKDLKIVKAELENKEAEFKCREAEAKARKAQAAAKKAEAKAIKAGNTEEAKKQNLMAQEHKAEARTKQDEIKEIKNKIKPEIKEASEKPQPIDPNPKGKPKFVEKKHLSAKGLLNIVHDVFKGIPDQYVNENESKPNITLSDCLMSGLALFSLKYSSLLQFDRDSQEGGCIHNNLKTLFNVNQTPRDTYMRERLDEIDPKHLREAFTKLFAQLQRGKGLEKYAFLDKYYLMSGDGTGYFSSKNINCKDCCTKRHKDGSVSYYHQMMSAVIVHPDYPTVIPLCPEPINNSDGSDKNDCERIASERLYRHVRREHPHLPLIVTEDALGSNGPHIKLLKELDMRFILVVKPDGNKSIFEYLKGIQCQECVKKDEEYQYTIKYINSIPLNDSHHDLNVNFIEIWVHDNSGNLKYHNSWVTDILITASNAYRLCQGGRAKWKIENETFNTLKNQGYHFEHNFGHGFKHLSTNFALLMFLAFLIDQIQQSCCGMFQAALAKMGSKTRLWSRMKAYFITLHIDSWEEFWQGIAFGIEEGRLTTKIRPQDTS